MSGNNFAGFRHHLFGRRKLRQVLEAFQGEPMDKAGAYDIDQHGALIIRRHTGSYSNIMGLPAETVAAWLRKQGLLPC